MALATIAFDLSVPDIFLPIFFGSKVVVVPSSETKDPYALIHLLETSRPTAMQATPTTWEMLIESNWNGDPNHLKIVCGGEALSKGLSERLLRKCKKLWNMYGPTETTVWSTAGLIHPDEDIHIGRPINNTRIAILNKHQQLIPDGHVGEIYILGDGVSNGYFNRTDLTREKFVPLNLFNTGEIAYRTGDIGRWDNNGNIEYLGRIDQQVKINGYRVECGEVEAAITQYDGIHKAVVRMTSSITTGKILTAYFTADHEIDEHDLRLFLRKTLPEFMVPGNYFQLQTFPVNANGKVDVKNLPEPLNDQSKKKKVHAPAAGLIENQIADVWQEVLGRSDLSVTDNFFETGGSSMRVLALFRELNILFPNILKVPDLFENATISDQASLIQKRSNSSVRKAEFNVLEY